MSALNVNFTPALTPPLDASSTPSHSCHGAARCDRPWWLPAVAQHEVLERYVGVYALSPQGTVTVTRTDTGLLAEATGLGMAPLYAASESEFL